jgi:hypothetical protein
MNIDALANASNNMSNQSMLNLTTSKIHTLTNNVLNNLNITHQQHNLFTNQLKTYMLVDELDEIKSGAYIRWISLNEHTILKRGALFCNIQISADGIQLICKHPKFNNYYQLTMDDNLIFQKLNNQQLIVLSALDYLS